MADNRITVGLVIERIALDGPWSDFAWMPRQVLPVAPETPAWTVLAEAPGRVSYYAGAWDLGLYPSSTAYYSENLASGRPSIWVAMQPAGAETPQITGVTVDPSEGESFTETGTSVVETVPMPPEIAGLLAAYVEEHHVERVFEKRQRDKSKPGVLDQRGPRSGRGS